MSDLFKKLNVLIKSSVNSTGRSEYTEGEQRSPRQQAKLAANLTSEVNALRERINDAVRYEDGLKAQLRQYEDDASRWDRQADEAVAAGNDAGARYAIEQMQRAEQRATMAQADLRAHQVATEDLIQRVNTLEAAVADAQRAQAAENPSPAATTPESLHLPDLGNVLREARDKIASLGELTAAQSDLDSAEQSPDQHDDAAIDDDLEQRRQRLSKP